MNTPMLGLFSHFEDARQGNWAGAKAAWSWCRSSAHREDVNTLVYPIQSPLGSPPRNLTVLWWSQAQASLSSYGTSGFSSQQPAQMMLGIWVLCVRLEMPL